MKRIHKAIKYLSLALLVSSIAMTIRAEETTTPVENTQVITPAVIVGQVAQAATVTPPVEIKPAVPTISPVEEVIKIFKPFFTDKNYKVNKSFKKMCLEAVAILKTSPDKGLIQVADFLETLCNKNIVAIGMALNNDQNKAMLIPLAQGTNAATALLAKDILLKRLAEAVAFKDK